MTDSSASSVPTRQQWRNELLMKNLANRDKDPTVAEVNKRLAKTICCSRTDCDKIMIERVPDCLYLRRSVLFPSLSTTYPAGRDDPPGKKGNNKDSANPPEPYNPPFCPCVIGREHLVTYCCVRRDCDDATKIMPERPVAFSHFKY